MNTKNKIYNEKKQLINLLYSRKKFIEEYIQRDFLVHGSFDYMVYERELQILNYYLTYLEFIEFDVRYEHFLEECIDYIKRRKE